MSEVDTTQKDTSVSEGDGSPAPDPIKNLKSEFERKLSNLEQSNAQLLAAIQNLGKPQQASAPQQGKKMSELIFEDADAAAEQIIQQAESRVEKKLAKQQDEQNKFNATVAQLYKEYPEVADQSSSLMQRAQEIYTSLGETTPTAMRAAVAQAASEHGIKPKSKREAAAKENDSFSMGSKTGGGDSSRKADKLDPIVEQLAAQFPQYIDLSKKEVRERLTTQHGRRTYKKWG